MKKTIALGAISAVALTGAAYSEIESEFHVGYNTTYVWRGLDFGDSMYEYGFDFAGSCDCGLDWAAGIWYANPSDETGEELDIYAEVSKDFGYGSLAVGFINYVFDGDGGPGTPGSAGLDNTELYASAGTSFAGLDLGATIYYVVDGEIGNPVTGELSAEYGYDVSDKLSASVGLSLGAILDSDGGDSYTWYGANLGLSYAVSDDISVNPYIAFADTDGASSLDTFSGVYGGVSIGYSF